MKLQCQKNEMARLRQQYPHAYCDGAVFHGTNLPPDQVLLHGIPATGGDNFDVAQHQLQTGRSALRGSCTAANIPAAFAGEGGFVYKLYPIGGGIDVNAALGEKRVDLAAGRLRGSIMPGEQEIAIASQQPACQIEGYYVVGAYSDVHEKYRLGKFVANPNFQPGAWEGRTFASQGRAA
ncbi:hypothetical protein IV102_27465 [bacterium]|nr:hypothetical protein [bacterium]